MSEPVELRGLKEVDETLVRLGSVAGAKVIRQALFAATKPILVRAQATVRSWRHGSGALFQALGRTFRKSSVDRGESVGGGRFTMSVGPKTRNRTAIALHNLFYRRQRRGIFYGHFLEFGHDLVHRYRTGKFNRHGREKLARSTTGRVAAKRFLRPALATGYASAVATFRDQLRKRVARALKKQDPASDNA